MADWTMLAPCSRWVHLAFGRPWCTFMPFAAWRTQRFLVHEESMGASQSRSRKNFDFADKCSWIPPPTKLPALRRVSSVVTVGSFWHNKAIPGLILIFSWSTRCTIQPGRVLRTLPYRFCCPSGSEWALLQAMNFLKSRISRLSWYESIAAENLPMPFTSIRRSYLCIAQACWTLNYNFGKILFLSFFVQRASFLYRNEMHATDRSCRVLVAGK